QVISYDIGKTIVEARGEVRKAIDIADFAVGLSRQLYGRTMHSERPHHRMYEQWHPLGVVGVITSFNFPVAVWAWNALIAAVCGDTILWKPSPKAILSAMKIQSVLEKATNGDKAFEGVFNLCAGSVEEVGEPMLHDSRIPLISATGSTAMGRRVGEVVASRFGKTILELGGNNALIITPHARLEHAVRAALFGAVGTSGQRCTSTRRLIVHSSVKERVITELMKAYKSLNIGDPLDESTHCGPLVDRDSYEAMMHTLKDAARQGGELLYGGERVLEDKYPNGYYVTPALVEISPVAPVVLTETFAPILYIMEYETIQEALAIQNNVPQGLSSALFSDSIREIEQFLSHEGSDCGIANINIGTSGAEIGGAFGGEKETGGGRESGS
ncbi:MAG TPA: aldehyde dehydrogenase family protein, partial [Methanothrix soehngenii]|nr:aldehyde dehydrogenase family protein [Methanothrix soehngenii]